MSAPHWTKAIATAAPSGAIAVLSKSIQNQGSKIATAARAAYLVSGYSF